MLSRFAPFALVLLVACGPAYPECPIVGTWRDTSADDAAPGSSTSARPNQTFAASGVWTQCEGTPRELTWRPATRDGSRITIEFPDAGLAAGGNTFTNVSAFRTFVLVDADHAREVRDESTITTWVRVE